MPVFPGTVAARSHRRRYRHDVRDKHQGHDSYGAGGITDLATTGRGRIVVTSSITGPINRLSGLVALRRQ